MRDSARQVERLQAIRLRYSINTHLENQGITTPTAAGATTGLPAVEVVRLLIRRQRREGDVKALQAIADHLGFMVRLDDLGRPAMASTKTGEAPPSRIGSPPRRCG